MSLVLNQKAVSLINANFNLTTHTHILSQVYNQHTESLSNYRHYFNLKSVEKIVLISPYLKKGDFFFLKGFTFNFEGKK